MPKKNNNCISKKLEKQRERLIELQKDRVIQDRLFKEQQKQRKNEGK